jgi:uncharacterized membrane protein SpoIIM required for sporulation/ABC-type transport system involved in multi-copper enzyme maturation permease subunit
MGEVAAGSSTIGDAAPRGRLSGLREQAHLVWVLTRREIRDTARDWRLVVPIVLLTLVFPLLLNFAAGLMLEFVRQYNASAVGDQAVPFLLLVVGFFPISFSLVIALETFVGEKERKSLEPLLATPLSNTQLYLGKTLAALIPPVLASLLGIGVYLTSLYVNINYRPPPALLAQIVLLTVAEAMVMVSGAVIISSQTTSVRAANLLASFIILPMAFLVQAEALFMFWSEDRQLWFVLLALIVCNIILVRMGIRIVNREELLGRQIDSFNLGRTGRMFKGFLFGPSEEGLPGPDGRIHDAASVVPLKPPRAGSRPVQALVRSYRHDVAALLRMNRVSVLVVLIGLAGALFVGWYYARRYPLPSELIVLEDISREAFDQYESAGFFPALTTWGILSHNVLSLLAAGALAMVSFGALAILLLMVPLALIGFLTVEVAMAGYSPLIFLGTFILPHGIVEMPAAIIATAAAVRLGMSIVAPPPGLTVGQSWLRALAHFVKLFVLVVLPLLALAALIEVHITPQLVIAVYGS